MPEYTAKLIVELQAHQKAVADHLATESKNETTKDLRKYAEERFDKNEENLDEHKTDTEQQFDVIFRANETQQAQLNNVEKVNNDFREQHCGKQAKDRIVDLVPGLTEEDTKPDTETYSIEIDPQTNPKASEARMLSLHQVQELFNVLLRRSDVQTRLTTSEKHGSNLEERIVELENWRNDLEERIKTRSEAVDKRFEIGDAMLRVFQTKVSDQFGVCRHEHTKNDERYDETQG